MASTLQKGNYQPDDGGARPTDGLARCVSCGSIASMRCPKCPQAVCDTICLQAHQLDHPAFAPAGPIRATKIGQGKCRVCSSPLSGVQSTYCSRECSVAGNRENVKANYWKRVMGAA